MKINKYINKINVILITMLVVVILLCLYEMIKILTFKTI
jgi:hypothetical protein